MAKSDAVQCDVTGRTYAACSVRECPEPNVIRRYGSGGKAHVSVYVCQKCKYAVHYQFFGGLSCELDEKYQAYKNRPVKRSGQHEAR